MSGMVKIVVLYRLFGCEPIIGNGYRRIGLQGEHFRQCAEIRFVLTTDLVVRTILLAQV